MKKFSLILAVLMGAAMLFVGAGCSDDDDDDATVSQLILNQTANQWYQYTGGDTSTSSLSGTESNSNTSQTLNNITTYVKYDRESSNLIVAACTENYYATNDKELGTGTWIGGVSTATLLGKITKVSSDPTKGKTEINVSNWGDLTAEALITKIFQ